MCYRLKKGFVAEELAGLDGVINSRSVHANNASGADVEMADLAVTHLTGAESHESAGGFYERVGAGRVPLIEIRSAGKCDRIAFSLGRVSEPVKHYQYDRRVPDSGQIRIVSLKKKLQITGARLRRTSCALIYIDGRGD